MDNRHERCDLCEDFARKAADALRVLRRKVKMGIYVILHRYPRF
jgi:hypothetical protein